MAASDNLNPDLFHGTAFPFRKGDIVLPAKVTGVSQNWGAKSKNNPNVAHATEDVESAKYFARVASLGEKNRRARVYQVEPVNQENAKWVEKRFAGGKGGSSVLREHVSPDGYRVIKRVWMGK